MLNKPVFIVNSPSSRMIYKEDRCQNDADEVLTKFFRPPITLEYLAAIAESSGFKTFILDCPASKISFKKFRRLILERKPGHVIVNISIQTLKDDLLALKVAHALGALTIIYGYYSTIEGQNLLKEHDFVDLAIVKEPELTLKDIFSSKEVASIPGLIYRDETGQVVKNEDRPFIEDLDMLPWPAHHLLNTKLYRHPLNSRRFLTIQVSRGCPYRCKFCLAELMNGSKFRTRSVENVLGEIEHVIKVLGIRNFFMRADTFTFDKEWVKNFCLELLKRNINIEWYTNSRVDTIDLDHLDLLKQSGCTLLALGVESGNPEHQKLLRKNLNLDQVELVFSKLKKKGIMSYAFFLIGTPFDTRESINETIEYSLKLDATFVEYTPYINFPGIELNTENFKPRIPRKIIMKYARQGKIKFYMRMGKILELTKIISRLFFSYPLKVLYMLKMVLTYAFRVIQ
ncbi:MAG: B12-binding domain-containing radical SAM protein [Promethearchaeota archaeon]